jgi:hypothetical protein
MSFPLKTLCMKKIKTFWGKLKKKCVPTDEKWLRKGCGQGVKMGLRKRWILEEKTY